MDSKYVARAGEIRLELFSGSRRREPPVRRPVSRPVGPSGLWVVAAGRPKELDERRALADFAFKEIFAPLLRPDQRLGFLGAITTASEIAFRSRFSGGRRIVGGRCRRFFASWRTPRTFQALSSLVSRSLRVRSLGRATPKRSGVLSHCRSRAKSQASRQPVASRRQAAAPQALAGALSSDGAPLVPARSQVLPDPIARRLVPHRHFCPSEDSRPILRDPEQGLPRARWSQRRPMRMATRVFAPTRQECGEPLAMARANASVDARYLAAVRKFSETLCLFLPRGPRRAELVPLISEQPQARERGGLHATRATPPTNPTRPAAAGARAPSSQALLGGGVRRGGGLRRTGDVSRLAASSRRPVSFAGRARAVTKRSLVFARASSSRATDLNESHRESSSQGRQS